jgi:hypothetical protein
MSADFVGGVSSASAPIPGLGQGLSLITGILGSQLAQHTARLQDATNENQALDILIPSWDADIQAICAAYNSGTPAADCIQAAQTVDNNAYTYLRKNVGKPGTAWDGSGKCTKSCTAGCCVFYNNLHSAIFGPSGAPYNGNIAAANGATGIIPAMQSGGGVCSIPKIFPPSDKSYGNYTRAGYFLTFKKPAIVNNAASALSVSGSGANLVVQAAVPAPPAPTTAVPVGATAGVLGVLTNNTLVTIVTLVGGVLIIAAYLFGSDSVRVK